MIYRIVEKLVVRITPAAVLIPGVQRRFFVYKAGITLQRRMPPGYKITVLSVNGHTTLQRFFSS